MNSNGGKMKDKIHLFKETIRKFLAKKDIKENNMEKISYEFIKKILEDPRSLFENYEENLKKKFSQEDLEKYKKEFLVIDEEIYKDKKFFHIIKILKKYGLNTEDRRNVFYERVKKLGNEFLEILDGKEDRLLELEKEYKYYMGEDMIYVGMKKTLGLGILIELLEGKNIKTYFTEKEMDEIRSIPIPFYKYLISDLIYNFELEFGIRKKKKAVEFLNEAKDMVEDSKEKISSKKINSLEEIIFERDSLKSSLKLIETNFKELREKIEEEALEAKKEAIGEFFVRLNSEKYGNFLDKIPKTEEILVNIRRNKLDENLSPEVKSVLTFIKQVIKFIKDSGIENIEEQNKIFQGTAEDIYKMSYIGQPFFNEGEKKWLKIIAPGYRYEDIVISIPKVEEIEE